MRRLSGRSVSTAHAARFTRGHVGEVQGEVRGEVALRHAPQPTSLAPERLGDACRTEAISTPGCAAGSGDRGDFGTVWRQYLTPGSPLTQVEERSSTGPGFFVYFSGFAALTQESSHHMAIDRARPNDRWRDEKDGAAATPVKSLTSEEASALRAKDPPLSPWWVIGVQFWVGVVVALFAALITGEQRIGWSALYGAATVVLPGALMARGMTSKLSSVSPVGSAVSFMVWEVVKIAVSIAMLMLAPKLVQSLSWPALLVGLVLCMKVYWLALLWRPASKKS